MKKFTIAHGVCEGRSTGRSRLAALQILASTVRVLGLPLLLILGPTISHSQQNDQPAPSPAQAETAPATDSTEITVNEADLETVIKIFSRRTNRNYILDERIKGKISIFLPGGVSDDDATEILEAALNLKGFASVPISDNLWKIVPAREAIQSTIPTFSPDNNSEPTQATITKLIKLKNIGADEVKELVSPLVGANGLINAYTGTNSLMLIDSERNISRILEIVDELDVPFSDRDLVVVPIQHATAADVAEKLTQIISEDSDTSDSASSGSGQNVADRIALIRQRIRESTGNAQRAGDDTSAASGGASGSTVGARSRAPKIIPDERTNSLILVADDATLARLRALIATLDSEVNLGGFRFWVYRAKYANAQELAEVLSGLGGGTGSSNRGSLGRDPDVISGSRNISSNSSSQLARTQNRIDSQTRNPGQPRAGSDATSGVTTAALGEDISISADIATNSLVIFADRTGYQKVADLLKELDVKRRQVLVEAMILEVRVTDGMTTGMEWLTSGGGEDGGVFASNRFGSGLSQLLQDPTALSGFSVAAASAGSLTLPGGITIPTQSILLQAAQSNANVNVLSAPTILATDNQEAEIIVGENVPFLASTSTSGDNLSNTFNQINRQDVGITLRLTPQISSDDSVKMQIFTEVSNLQGETSALGPTTTIRTSSTTVVSKDSQMIVIGGLMSDRIADSEDGVPFLNDIPVLGTLFGQRGSSTTKNNLLIFITPRIIKDQYDARDSTKLHSGKLGEEIDGNNVYPRRDEILKNRDIDAVAELEVLEYPEMGTLRPSGALSTHSGQNNIIKLRPEPTVDFQATDTDDNTTNQIVGDTALALQRQDARAVANIPAPHFAPLPRLVSLKLMSSDSALAQTPFKEFVIEDRFSVLLGADLPIASYEFFRPGERYQYIIGSEVLELQCLESKNIANSDVTKAQQDAYSPSAFEILEFGNGPWRKAGSQRGGK
jgi:general secretion pathway protein D